VRAQPGSEARTDSRVDCDQPAAEYQEAAVRTAQTVWVAVCLPVSPCEC
jgi:hypothetical protein